MREIIQTLAKVAGKKAPSRALPTVVLKASAPFGPIVGKALGYPPNLRELISTSDGVTYWARHDKAIELLGYSPRGLEQGLRDMLEAEGKLPVAA
jgi:nucleoside-diphosphate-sugar epimerase